MIQKRLLILLTGLSIGILASAQCEIEIIQPDTTVCKNDMVILSATGMCGFFIQNDFDNGTLGLGWASNASPIFSNPCPPTNPPASGLTCWIGGAASWPRQMTTIGFDISNQSGCIIEFDMKYGANQNTGQCESPDLPTEGVHLQWRSGNPPFGQAWVDINYWTPVAGNAATGPLYTWNHYTQQIPVMAYSPGTQIRWWQDVTSGNGFDHWGIDNVSILCDDPGHTITWWPGNDTGNFIQVYANMSAVYFATISDGTHSATDTAIIYVFPGPDDPIGQDTIICDYHSIQLSLPAYASNPVWSNGSGLNYAILDSNYLAYDSLVWVEYNDSSGCRVRDSVIILLDECAGVNELEANNLQIYPQPSNGQVVISWPGHPIDEIIIYDMNGKLLLREEYHAESEPITLKTSNSIAGSYIIHIRSGDTIIRKKIVQTGK